VTRKKRIGKEKRKEKETKGNSVYIPSIRVVLNNPAGGYPPRVAMGYLPLTESHSTNQITIKS
jgi:hypothetical protein